MSDQVSGGRTTRVCLAVAFVAVVVGIGATFMPVDRCGMAWKAAFDPERAIVYDGPEPARQTTADGRPRFNFSGLPRPGSIYRSRAFCEQHGRTRLTAAGAGSATVAVAALGVALLLRRR